MTISKYIKVLPDSGGILPMYATQGSAGFDIHAAEDATIFPGDCKTVRTGLALARPLPSFMDGLYILEIQIRQRSGLSVHYPNYLAIGTGTIDADYTGEILLPIVNNRRFNDNSMTDVMYIKKGDRMAQGVINEVVRDPRMARGDKRVGGFSSTGR